MSDTPRLFISYSWTTPEHEEWVVNLATELVSSGVDVILDKWNLREGHDSVAFMEQMVTDPSIKKVLLICDKGYADKTDGRKGGVGTEAQIISPQVYEKQNQDKFVAVVAEKDLQGKPYLPTYYRSRIYIDLSESERYAENFEKLLRWVFDRPLYVKPAIGKPPSYISEPDAPVLGTAARAKRVVEAFRNDRAYARGALEEYLNSFASQLELYRITQWAAERDESVAKSIEEFLPARNELISVISMVLQYGDEVLYGPILHRFYESLLPYMDRPEAMQGSYYETDWDNYKFVVYELFLYGLALVLRNEKFEAATILIGLPYYNPSARGESTVTFSSFWRHIRSLEVRNQRLQLRRLSLHADWMKQRSEASGVHFRHLMQADFVCFLRASLVNSRWWPETLLYASHQHGSFEIFARATSKSYATKVLRVVGATSIGDLTALVEDFQTGKRPHPRWEFESFDSAQLSNASMLGSVP